MTKLILKHEPRLGVDAKMRPRLRSPKNTDTSYQLALLKNVAKHRSLRQRAQWDELVVKVAEVAAAIAIDKLKAGETAAVYEVPDATEKQVDLAERKRLLASTKGIWKDRGIDGLDYQLAERAEW